MKNIYFTKISPSRENVTTSRPIKVCMHVLVRAANDQRVMRAATALVKAGYTVSVIDIEDEESHQARENIRNIHMDHILVSRSFLTTRFNKWIFVRALLLFVCSILRLLQTEVDIYHAHDVSALPACYIAACLRRKPVIFEAHEMPLFDIPVSEMHFARKMLHNLLRIFLAYMVPRCSGVITVSPPIVEDIRHRYHVSNVSLVRSVPEYRDVPKSDRLRQCLGLKPEVRIALYQGYLQHNRGLDVLVRAAAFLKRDIVIVMMGKNVDATQEKLDSLIASEGVADCVKILPHVPYTELLDWTASADVGLTIFSPDYSLNLCYVLPNKLFEYLMAGLPVLTTSLEAVVDVVTKYDVGQVVSSLAPEDIANAINAMLADPIRLASMRDNALKAAREELNWEKERLQLTQLYASIFRF